MYTRIYIYIYTYNATFSPPKIGLPNSSTLIHYTGDFQISAVTISGSHAVKIVTIIKDTLGPLLVHEFHLFFTHFVDDNLKAALALLDTSWAKYLVAVEPVSPPLVPDGSVVWINNTALQLIDYILNVIVANGIDGFISATTPGHPGIIHIPINLAHAIPLSSTLSLSVGIIAVNATGLDKWSSAVFFEPVTNYSLMSNVCNDVYILILCSMNNDVLFYNLIDHLHL